MSGSNLFFFVFLIFIVRKFVPVLRLFLVVFVIVNFCGAFRAPDHGENLLGTRTRLLLKYYITPSGPGGKQPKTPMTPRREYPDQPLVGVGGVVIDNGRTLLIRRGSAPLKG